MILVIYNWRKRSDHIKAAIKYIRTSGSQRERNGLDYSEFFTTLDFHSSGIRDMGVINARAMSQSVCEVYIVVAYRRVISWYQVLVVFFIGLRGQAKELSRIYKFNSWMSTLRRVVDILE